MSPSKTPNDSNISPSKQKGQPGILSPATQLLRGQYQVNVFKGNSQKSTIINSNHVKPMVEKNKSNPGSGNNSQVSFSQQQLKGNILKGSTFRPVRK